MAAPFTGRPTAEAAVAILSFWFDEAKPYQWFRRDDAFDEEIRTRFGALHLAAIEGRLDAWRAHPRHSLALIILLDQFSRNMFRDTPRAFAQDPQALDVAREAIRRRFDALYEPRERSFFYMPFMHSEELTAQEACVALFKSRMPSSGNLSYAEDHCDIVRCYGRFPHRNKILVRASTLEERAFLKAGGFNP